MEEQGSPDDKVFGGGGNSETLKKPFIRKSSWVYVYVCVCVWKFEQVHKIDASCRVCARGTPSYGSQSHLQRKNLSFVTNTTVEISNIYKLRYRISL